MLTGRTIIGTPRHCHVRALCGCHVADHCWYVSTPSCASSNIGTVELTTSVKPRFTAVPVRLPATTASLAASKVRWVNPYDVRHLGCGKWIVQTTGSSTRRETGEQSSQCFDRQQWCACSRFRVIMPILSCENHASSCPLAAILSRDGKGHFSCAISASNTFCPPPKI